MTKKEQQLLVYTRNKVRELLRAHPTPGHAFDHAIRVSRYARHIAASEKHGCFLAEFSGLVHDIGYTEHIFGAKKSHHELSYQLCQRWFRHDQMFDVLTVSQKYIILYSVRYHGNDDANKYKTAWITRDADKLDALGITGLRRSYAYCVYSGLALNVDFRLRFHIATYIRSRWAKRLVKEKDLLKPFRNALIKMNHTSIKPIRL